MAAWLLAVVMSSRAVVAEEETQGRSQEDLLRIIEQQQKVIEALQKRVETLEKRLDETHPKPEKPAPSDTTHAHKDIFRSGFNVKFYGFLRGDLEADTRRMNFDSQLPFFVLSPADPSQTKRRTGEITFHPRLTRFGFDVNAPKLANGWQATAKLETDFFNAIIDRPAPANPNLPAGPNNPFLARDLVSGSRAALRIRQAYVRIQKGDWHILMGQAWDVISPFFPSLNANTVMWNAGNTADRRPQFRVGYEPKRGQGQWSFVGMVGASGAVDGQDLDGDGFRDGEGASTPTIQARVGYTAPSRVKGQNWSVGIWGHTAHQEVNRFTVPTAGGGTSFSSHLMGMDVSLPLSSKLRLQGEIWTGKNLSDVRGGIGQGIDVPTGKEVSAKGGWLEVSYRVSPRYTFNVGMTLDQPDASDLTPASARTRNSTLYLTNRYSFGNGLSMGFDWAYWKTKFKALPTGTNNRFTFFVQQDF
ncbi:MAG: hypothetical protein NZT92_14275 [Abditibacteriales bacterium]|nr:hypothetical protein [Abditibacteriales bacterium]MDW8367079.1 hypothetical protein [Abditibacteriales bacterium]